MTNSIAEIEDADCMFVIGSNTTEAHPVLALRMKKALRRGAKLIVADPRRTWLADRAHWHLQLKPGTDIPLLNGIANVILEEGLEVRTSLLRAGASEDRGDRGADPLLPMDDEVDPIFPVSLRLAGLDDAFLVSSRLDNQLSCFVATRSLLEVADRPGDAIPVLKEVIRQDSFSKLGYRRLAEASVAVDDLKGAASAYVELFSIDPRDGRVAISISDVYLEDNDYGKALRWADKSTSLTEDGSGYSQKGKVYFYGWDNFRQNPFTTDDRIVAKLAFDYFVKADEAGYNGFSKREWMAENARDILYGKAQWFMAEDKVKRSRSISTRTSDYDWVTESLKAESGWK